jgi:hypothetical protein
MPAAQRAGERRGPRPPPPARRLLPPRRRPRSARFGVGGAGNVRTESGPLWSALDPCLHRRSSRRSARGCRRAVTVVGEAGWPQPNSSAAKPASARRGGRSPRPSLPRSTGRRWRRREPLLVERETLSSAARIHPTRCTNRYQEELHEHLNIRRDTIIGCHRTARLHAAWRHKVNRRRRFTGCSERGSITAQLGRGAIFEYCYRYISRMRMLA